MDRWKAELASELQLGRIRAAETLSGGCIHLVERWRCDSQSVVVKSNRQPVPGIFEAESRGLQALADSQTLRVPQVLAVSERYLVLEDLGNGIKRNDFDQQLGQGLAMLHRLPQSDFGFTCNTFCGSTLQLNPMIQDGWVFFGEYRLCFQARLARDNGYIDSGLSQRIDAIAQRLAQWIPYQASALIHGDLWSGNVHCCTDGRPALIDPAAYWGWPEADLAMTRLFGGFGRDFYDAYNEARPLEPEFEQRIPLYNLYHLLNHLNLFGGSYLAQVCRIVADFTD